jgi:pimeloyl-ACP methyl ester carboxylesterase
MVLKLRTLLMWLILFSAVSVGFADAASASIACSNFIKAGHAPKSIGYYLDAVNRQRDLEPKFLEPAKEAALAKTAWRGTKEGPLLLKQTLHSSTALIDHQLLTADAGTVKSASSGNFVSMRLRQQWNGKDMSTNLGLSSDSLITKTLEGSNKLVPNSAKAVFIFMHGWGTKTTGHHVAAAFSNFLAPYGIVVLSIDAPHHAYGPRVTELSPREYATYLRDFRNEFIPEDVPTFIGGHSGGGFIADMMMRFSDDPVLGIGNAFAGAINLSGPMDGAPGKSLAEKNAAEELINTNKEIMELVPEAERDLSVLLLTQGKSSATSGLSAEGFMSSVDWVKPKHNGSKYIPTLVVMGERDGLYVGREKVFQEHLAGLENTDTHLMGKRPDFKGVDNWVSHMIFDHYRPGTKDPETFNVVKDFIAKQIGLTLEKSKGSNLAPEADRSKVGILMNVVQEYYNNLAFRKFAKEFIYVTKTASPEAQQIGAKSGVIGKLLGRTQKELGRLKKSEPENIRVASLEKRVLILSTELNRLKSTLTSEFIPEGELKDFAIKNVSERALIKEEVSKSVKEKQKSIEELRTLRDTIRRDKKAFDALVENLIWSEALKSPEVKDVQAEINSTLQTMIDLQIKMNEANSELVKSNIEKGIFAVNPGPEEIKAYKELDAGYAAYNAAMEKGRAVVGQAVGEGLASDTDLTLFNTLYGSVDAFVNDTPIPESLLGQESDLVAGIEVIDKALENFGLDKDRLLKDYIDKVTPGLYTFTETKLFDELNKPIADLIKNSSGIEPLWRIWSDIWKERPPEQGTSLY